MDENVDKHGSVKEIAKHVVISIQMQGKALWSL